MGSVKQQKRNMFIKLSRHEQYLKLTNNVEEGTNKLTHYSYLDKISIEAKIFKTLILKAIILTCLKYDNLSFHFISIIYPSYYM